MNIQSNESYPHDSLSQVELADSSTEKLRYIQVPFSERRALLIVVDAMIVLAAVWGALALWHVKEGQPYSPLYIVEHWYSFPILLGSWILFAWLRDLYDIPSSTHKILTAVRIVSIGPLAFVIYLAVFFVAPALFPRFFFIYFLVVVLPLIMLWRWVYAVVFTMAPFRHRVLVVGDNQRGATIAKVLWDHPLINHDVVGYVDNRTIADTERANSNVPLLGNEADLERLTDQLRIHEIVVAIEDELEQDLFHSLIECQAKGVHVTWMPDLYEMVCRRVPIEHIDPTWALHALQRYHAFSRLESRIKRALDLALVVLSLPSLLLIFPVIALLIRLDSPGPIFYRQTRCGQGGRLYKIVKFRTMGVNAEQDGKARWASEGDPRITRVGKFLRRSRLDELPQLFNVVRGEMSIVGPRPERPEFVQQLEREIPFYRTRLIVKPGITGWAQINYDYANSVEDALAKLQYDFYYIRYHSIPLDIYIMFRTVSTLLQLKGT